MRKSTRVPGGRKTFRVVMRTRTCTFVIITYVRTRFAVRLLADEFASLPTRAILVVEKFEKKKNTLYSIPVDNRHVAKRPSLHGISGSLKMFKLFVKKLNNILIYYYHLGATKQRGSQKINSSSNVHINIPCSTLWLWIIDIMENYR